MTANEDLLDAFVRRQINLLRVSRGLRNEAFEVLDGTERDLRRAIRDRLGSGRVGLKSAGQVLRLRALLDEVREIRAGAWREVGRIMRKGVGDVSVAEARFVEAAARTVSPAQLQTILPAAKDLRRAALKDPFLGRTLGEWIAATRNGDARAIADQITIGVTQGEAPREVAARVVGTRATGGAGGATARTRRQMETLAVTASNHAASRGRDIFIATNDDLFEVLLFIATLDSRTTAICVEGSTQVRPIGLVEKLYRRRYRGDVIIVTTASGKELIGTPNHPVLTSDGWLSLEEVEPGKQILYSVGLDSSAIEGVQDVDVPPSIAELFDAANDPAFSHVLRECPSAADFHGDGVGTDGEVDVLVAKCPLRLTAYLRGTEKSEDNLLRLVQDSSSLPGLCGSELLRMARRPVSKTSERHSISLEHGVDAGLTSSCKANDFGRPGAFAEHANDASSILANHVVDDAALPMWHDASLLQKTRDSGRGRFVIDSDRPGGFPCSVVGDDVVSVRREFRSTHVYNLETCRGVYIANGLLVHNCRSLDGETFELDDEKRPVLPLHHRERSLILPTLDPEPMGTRPARNFTQKQLLREFAAENGFDAPTSRAKLPRGTKGAFDAFARKRMRELTGQVPAKTTYSEFLKRQSAANQDDILGKTKGRLFRRGDLTLDKFVDESGRELRLDELAKLEPDSFRRAGLDPEDFFD